MCKECGEANLLYKLPYISRTGLTVALKVLIYYMRFVSKICFKHGFHWSFMLKVIWSVSLDAKGSEYTNILMIFIQYVFFCQMWTFEAKGLDKCKNISNTRIQNTHLSLANEKLDSQAKNEGLNLTKVGFS